MGFEKIQLTAEQVGELYSSHLVITGNEAKPVVPVAEKTDIPVKGKNKKHFVWVVNEPGFPFLDDADFQFMGDVINACKMNMDDIALVNLANGPVNFSAVSEQLQPRYLIISAQNLDWLPFSSVHYEFYPMNDFQLYCTETLAELRNDKVKKSKLWLALKQMLGL